MFIRRQVFGVVLMVGLSAPVHASGKAATYDITHVYSNVSFSIAKFFFTEDGGFKQYSGEIFYDPDHPELSHVRMTVQAESIDTRNETRDHALRSDDFFDVARFPTLGFVSTSVTPGQNGELRVAGDLTIHGVTKHITIPAHFLGAKQMQGWGDFVGFESEFIIDRTEFGVNGTRWSGGSLILGKQVTVHLSIGAFRRGTR